MWPTRQACRYVPITLLCSWYVFKHIVSYNIIYYTYFFIPDFYWFFLIFHLPIPWKCFMKIRNSEESLEYNEWMAWRKKKLVPRFHGGLRRKSDVVPVTRYFHAITAFFSSRPPLRTNTSVGKKIINKYIFM